ncbi:MAG: DUF1566 domain-containing protein, partial [Myxococcaceae bacterium]
MKSAGWLITCYFIVTPLFAERLIISNLTDETTHQLFNQLNRFENAPQNAQVVQVAANAMNALLDTVSPWIKKLTNYKGLFSGNCSVFFDKTLDFGACDLAASDSPVVASALSLKESKRLPEIYLHQISLSNILLATVFGDWRRGTLEKYQTDLFFKQSGCTDSETSSPSRTATQTASLLLPKTLTDIVSSSDSNSASRSSTQTDFETLSPSGTATQTASLSLPKTLTDTVSSSHSSSASSSLTETKTTTKSLITQSKTLSQSPSLSRSASPTFAETATKTMTRLSGLLAAWNTGAGAYEDATNQTSRYNASLNIVTDASTGLEWQLIPSLTTMTWDQAVSYCVAQITGGFSDWRLPNNAELQSLVDYTINYVGATPGINAIFTGTPTSYFWSSTPLVGSPGQVWYVSYGQTAYLSGLVCSKGGFGVGACDSVPANGYTRCVRSPYWPLPAERYTTTSDTVTDTITGLIWQRVHAGTTMNQTAALAYCNTLSLPSFSAGWRLPKVKELATLVDYSVPYGNLMMDVTVFAGEPANGFWSSTLRAVSTGVWYIAFDIGIVDGDGLTNLVSNGYVSCVRVLPLLLAVWNQAGGAYADTTNQLGRYAASAGIVNDTLTNIQWEQTASAGTMDWTKAATYCAAQTTGGLNGWRVPNIAELESLVDYTISYTSSTPGINAIFTGTPTSYFWSSILLVGSPGQVWYVSYGQTAY